MDEPLKISLSPLMKAGGIILDSPFGSTTRFYCVHRPQYDDWSFPKGDVEQGENLFDAALREVKEETGLTCKIVRNLPLYRYTHADGQRVHVYFFEMHVTSEEERTDAEVDRGEWKTLEEAIALLSYPTLTEYFRVLY